MAHGADPDFLEIIRGELRQKLEFDSVLAKRLLIHTQTEIVEPGAMSTLASPLRSLPLRKAYRKPRRVANGFSGSAFLVSRSRQTRLFDRGLWNVGLRRKPATTPAIGGCFGLPPQLPFGTVEVSARSDG